MSNPLDRKTNPPSSPKAPADQQPDTVATPGGDNEYEPDQPIEPAPEGLQRSPAIDTNKL